MAYIWLKNRPSRQVQREKASERVIFGNVPEVQQPLRFESPCGNRENFNLVQGGERSCVRGSGVPYGIRTRAANVKGWCPRPLDERDKAERGAL